MIPPQATLADAPTTQPAPPVTAAPTTDAVTATPTTAAPTITTTAAPAMVRVPALSGTGYAKAVTELESRGLHASKLSEASKDVPAGKVIRTEPGANEQVPAGTTVKVIVSTGAPTASPTTVAPTTTSAT